MNAKAIIIGASTVGKTTLLEHLRTSTDFQIDEADKVLTEMNGGTYPHDSKNKLIVLAPRMVEDVLRRESVLFFTNTDYFKLEDLEKARSFGFKIFQLTVPLEEMERRNKYRMEHKGYDDLSSYFEVMIAYQQEIKEKGLVDKEIDSSQPIGKIADDLIQQLDKK